MLHILLLILKILGIGLLLLLAALLLIVCLLLFVPVRYKGSGSYLEKKLKGSGSVRWLWGIVSLYVAYDEQPVFRLRLFGFPLFQKKGKKRRPKRSKRRKKQPKETSDLERGAASEEKPSLSDQKETSVLQDAEEPAPDTEENVGRIQGLLYRIGEKLHGLVDGFRSLREKWEMASAFWEDPENREMIKFLWTRTKGLFRHLLPRKIKGRVMFGTEDPYITGKILTYLSFLYPIYGKNVVIQPVFDEAVLEAEGSFRGRIRGIHFLTAAIRILCNKKIRTQLKRFLDK